MMTILFSLGAATDFRRFCKFRCIRFAKGCFLKPARMTRTSLPTISSESSASKSRPENRRSSTVIPNADSVECRKSCAGSRPRLKESNASGASRLRSSRWRVWRGDRRWSIVAKENDRLEAQFDVWDATYPMSLEILRGRHGASLSVNGPRMSFKLNGLAYVLRPGPADLPAPKTIRRRRGFRAAVRAAIDWETVTPIEELPADSLTARIKRRLRKIARSSQREDGAFMNRFHSHQFDALACSQDDWLEARVCAPQPRNAVLLHAPSHVWQAPGGGENQLIQTARHLEDQGVLVRPFVSWTDRLDRARLLHLFGMSREGLELAKNAKSRGTPIVLLTICWVEPCAVKALANNHQQMLWELTKHAFKSFAPRLPSWRRQLLGLADAILPNSRAEADQLVRLFGADESRIRIVPNGVDSRFAAASPRRFQDRHGNDPFVLYVGRIEPRKNVLNLIRAAKLAGLPLVVLGDPVPGHEAYASACRAEGKAFVRFLPKVDHADPLLASAYAACRVFALPSWFETPGLAALEAGLARKPIVITPYGCTREYFQDQVIYARPDRVGEIVRGLRKAWREGSDPRLAGRIEERFLWSEAARATREAYDEIAL